MLICNGTRFAKLSTISAMEDYTRWENFCITLAGAQLEIFKDRDPIHKQGHITAFQKMIWPVNIANTVKGSLISML